MRPGKAPAGIDEQMRNLWDSPGPASRFPVYLRLVYCELDYGFDWGMLTVLDGGLLFQGLRTDFSLTRANTGLYPWTLSLPRPGPQIELEYKAKLIVKVSFELLPYQGDNPYSSPPPSRFRELCEAVRGWSTHEGQTWEDAVGPPVVPMLEIARTYRRRGVFWKGIVLAAVVGTVAAFVGVSLREGALATGDGLLLFWFALLYVTGALWFKGWKEWQKAKVMADMAKWAGSDGAV